MRSKCFRKNSVIKARKKNNLKKTKDATEVAMKTVLMVNASTVIEEVVMVKTEAIEEAMALTDLPTINTEVVMAKTEAIEEAEVM